MANFASSRLSVARRRKGMTQKYLAERCGVSPQLMSFFEKGQRMPSDDVLHKIAFVLGFSPRFFCADEIDLIDPEIPSFRSRRSMTRKLRDSALAAAEIVTGVISPDLNQRFEFPSTNMPELSWHKFPENAAEELRKAWQLGDGPISNMVHLLESKGVEVYWLDENSPTVDAVSFFREDKAFVILNSNKNSGERSRFDAAHELGHLVLHRNMKGSLDSLEIETQANQFASAFLMPKIQVELEWPKRPHLQLLFSLKSRWKVSAAAMIYRGKEVGVFSEWQARDAFKKLSASGMHKGEKAPVSPEQSFIHNEVFRTLKNKDVSPIDYAKELFLNRESLFDAMPAAKNFIQTQDEQVIPMRRSLRLLA